MQTESTKVSRMSTDVWVFKVFKQVYHSDELIRQNATSDRSQTLVMINTVQRYCTPLWNESCQEPSDNLVSKEFPFQLRHSSTFLLISKHIVLVLVREAMMDESIAWWVLWLQNTCLGFFYRKPTPMKQTWKDPVRRRGERTVDFGTSR